MNAKFKERRQFIKLASGLLATPFVSLAAGNAFSAETKSPLRLLTIIDSYGIPTATRNEIWVDSTAGDYALSGDELGTILSPLKAYKDNMLIPTGINLDSLSQTGDTRQHAHMTTHTLCGSRRVSGSESTIKIKHASLDVHVGQYLNNDGLARAYPHLFFSNYSEPAKNTFCHDETGAQIRSIAGAKDQATSIFTDGADLLNLQYQNKVQQGVFDLVQKQVQGLRGQLNNVNASAVMDAYQSSVDDLAAQLQLSSNNVCEVPEDIASFPSAGTGQSTATTPFIFKNIFQAFACDLTSSLTYAVGGETINQLNHKHLYNEAEHGDNELKSLLTKNMHAASHQVSDVANKTHELIRIHQAELIATLLDDMSITLDTDGGTLLDNTVVFWTSAMSNNTHQKDNYAHLLIAGKNTNLKGGFHYDCAGSTNNDLLTTIAQGMGLPDDNFGGHNKDGVYLNALNNGPISKMLVS